MKRGILCAVHKHKVLVPQNDHHILPQEFGGPTTKANLALVCVNGHVDTHYFLDLLLKYEGEVPWEIAEHFYFKVRDLAKRGYDEIKKRQSVYDAAQIIAIGKLDNDEKMESFGRQKLALALAGR